HHLGKRHARLRPVVRHAIPARERELEPPAHAEDVDQRHGGKGQRRDLVEDLVPEPHEGRRLLRARDARELVDVRARGEAVLLGGEDREAPGRHRRQVVCELPQLAQHLARDRVGRRALAIEREPRQVVRVEGELPVPEVHLVVVFSGSGLPKAQSLRLRMWSVFSTSATVTPPASTISTRNVGSNLAPDAVAARASAMRSSGRWKRAVTVPRAGLRKRTRASLSHTTYSGPRFFIMRIMKNGSVIEKSEPPKCVPT